MTDLAGRWRVAILGGLFVVAFVIAFAMVRPIASASIGPDAAAPVIHFERLLAGQRLDGHLTQTAKPLLTAIYGVLYAATGDWRPIAWAAIAAFALCRRGRRSPGLSVSASLAGGAFARWGSSCRRRSCSTLPRRMRCRGWYTLSRVGLATGHVDRVWPGWDRADARRALARPGVLAIVVSRRRSPGRAEIVA